MTYCLSRLYNSHEKHELLTFKTATLVRTLHCLYNQTFPTIEKKLWSSHLTVMNYGNSNISCTLRSELNEVF